MNYFDGCANLSEAKARRNELMREFHPDNLTRITQEANAAYEQVQRDARADGTLPASYQVKAAQPVTQAAPRIVYQTRIVERTVYRDAPCSNFEALRHAQPDQYFECNGQTLMPSLNQRESDSWQGM